MSTEEFRELVALINESSRDRVDPLIVAIDGRSGAGKSTLASALAQQLGAAAPSFYPACSCLPRPDWTPVPTTSRRSTG